MNWMCGTAVVVLLLGVALAAGCATKATSGAFAPVGRIESELRRGESAKMDFNGCWGLPRASAVQFCPRTNNSERSGSMTTLR